MNSLTCGNAKMLLIHQRCKFPTVVPRFSSFLPSKIDTLFSLDLSSITSSMETNLAATTAARKERLIALRKRKQAAEQGNGTNGGP